MRAATVADIAREQRLDDHRWRFARDRLHVQLLVPGATTRRTHGDIVGNPPAAGDPTRGSDGRDRRRVGAG